MTAPVTFTIHFTPHGAAPDESLHLELSVPPGARLSLDLGTPAAAALAPAEPVVAEPAPTCEDTSTQEEADSPTQPLPQPRSARDWDLPDLPAACAPGRKPDLLTGEQSRARLFYGYQQRWTERRIARFAGRAVATVHKHITRFRQEEAELVT